MSDVLSKTKMSYPFSIFMKKISILTLALFLGAFNFVKAQETLLIGLVLNSDSLPLQGASVVLSSKNNQSKLGSITSERGRFRFKDMKPGAYELRIDFVGYEAFSKEIELTEGPNFAGRIVLGEKSYELKEVVIKGQVPPSQQKGDTTEYNSDAFKTNPDATTENLLEKMPGISVQNGQVQAQGEQVKQVLVDGKPFFGSDPSAALKNLPAEVVQKIQVFDQQSEQAQATGFDDGETTKTINIVTKPEMRNGTFGRIFAGGGLETPEQARYSAGGSLNIFDKDRRISILGQSNNINQQNFASEDLTGVASSGGGRRRGFGGGPGGGGRRGGSNVSDFLVNEQGGIATTNAFGINYSDNWGKKIEVAGSYFFNQTDNLSQSLLRQEYINNGEFGQIYTERDTGNSSNLNHRLNLRMEFSLSDRTSIIFQPRLTIQENSGTSFSSALTSLAGQDLNESNTNFESDLSAISSSNFLVFRHRFEKRGRSISVAARASYDKQNGESFLNSDLLYYTEPASTTLLRQNSTLQNNSWNIRGDLRYSEPLGKLGMLQLFYRINPQLEESDKQTLVPDNGSSSFSLLDTALSNTFNSAYLTHEPGAGLFIRKEKLFLISRIGYQFAQLQTERVFPAEDMTERTFNAVVPFVMLRYRASRSNDMRLMYMGRTTAPRVTQLQDVIDNSNPLQLTSGNPELNQSYSHRVNFRLNKTNTEKNRTFIAFLNATFEENYIGQQTLRPRRDTTLPGGFVLPAGSQYTAPVNLDGYFVGRAFVSTGKLIEKLKINLNIDASLDYRRQPGLINEELNYSNTTALGLGVVVSSNFSENIDFTVSSRTTANQVMNTLQTTQNSNYLQQDSRARLNLIMGPKIVFRSTLTHTLYAGLSDGFNQNFWLWNLGLAKKFGKKDQAEIQVSTFDALRQNTSVQRTVTDNYIQDLENLVLQRYLMLTLTYNIRNFTGGADINMDRRREGQGPPRW